MTELDKWLKNCPVCEKELSWWGEPGNHQYCTKDDNYSSTGHYGAIFGIDGKVEPILTFENGTIERLPRMFPEDVERYLKLRAFQ